jgi:hypothetical protein
MERTPMHDSMEGISHLEIIAKERLRKNVSADLERLNLLTQLIRYGVCTCHCHYSTSVYHSAAPCCANARLTATN